VDRPFAKHPKRLHWFASPLSLLQLPIYEQWPKAAMACQKVEANVKACIWKAGEITSYVNGMVDVLNSLRNGRRIGDKSWAKVMQ
jgi:hypothetical protein